MILRKKGKNYTYKQLYWIIPEGHVNETNIVSYPRVSWGVRIPGSNTVLLEKFRRLEIMLYMYMIKAKYTAARIVIVENLRINSLK